MLRVVQEAGRDNHKIDIAEVDGSRFDRRLIKAVAKMGFIYPTLVSFFFSLSRIMLGM